MSFKFQWPEFSPEFHADARSMLNSALNRGPKPKVIADDIRVEELSMGSVPPDLEILEIGDLSKDRFRGIFRLTYAGDAHIVLSTKVQANPLSKASPSPNGAGSSSNSLDGETFAPFSTGSATRGILFAAAPLVVPMQLRLSHVRLRAIIVLVVSKTKGITLVFKNDPLESVQVSSTFDSVAVIAKYLQQEIEGQLKEVFREDLPGIIHRLSQGWLNGQRPSAASKKSEKSSAKDKSKSREQENATASSSNLSAHPAPPSTSGSRKSTHRKSTSGRKSGTSKLAAPAPPTPSDPSPTTTTPNSEYLPPLPIPSRQQSFDRDDSADEVTMPFSTSFEDIEAHDPTYGLRPDEVRLPKKGHGFRGLKNLKRGMSMTGGVVNGNGNAGGSAAGFGLGGLLYDEAVEQRQRQEEDAQKQRSVVGAEDDRECVDDGDEWDVDEVAGPGVESGRRSASSSASSSSSSSSSSSHSSASSSSSAATKKKKKHSSNRHKQAEERSVLDFVDPFQEHFSDFTKPDFPSSPPKKSSASGRRSKKAASAVGTMSSSHSKGKQRARESSAHIGSGLAGLNGLASGVSSPLASTPSARSSTPARIVQQHHRLHDRGPSSDSGAGVIRRPPTTRQQSTSSLASSIVRPRIFHTSSLIRAPDLGLPEGSEDGGGGGGASSIAGSSSTYGYGRYLGVGLRSSRPTSSSGRAGGGSSSTVLGIDRDLSGSGSAPMSAVGSSRTFTIGRKAGSGTAGSIKAGSGAPSTIASRDYFTSSHHPDEVEDTPPTAEDADSASSSHRNSNSNSSASLRTKSKAGTLATLEPEPMSESGSNYKRHVWKEMHSKGNGFYRPGWERER